MAKKSGAVQLGFTFDSVHRMENNPDSQRNLDLRREDFNLQCWTVLMRMLRGERLTALSAINSGVGDVRRRALDLIEMYRIPVRREWSQSGRYKEYYIDPSDVPMVMRRILDEIDLSAQPQIFGGSQYANG